MTSISFAELVAAITEAERLLHAGEWRGAKDLYEPLLLSGGVGGELSNRLLLAERLADIAVTLGDYEEADALYAALADDFGARGDWTHADIALLKRVHVALSRERLDDAIALLRGVEPRTGELEALSFTADGTRRWEAEVAWSGSERPLALAQFYLEAGRIFAGTGQYSDAIAGLRRGLEQCGDTPDLRYASSAIRLATAACRMERGDLAGAREELSQVTGDGSLQAAPGASAQCLEISAKLHLLQGNFASAESELSAVLQLCRSMGAVRGTARAALNLAELQVILNRIPEAVENLAASAALATGDMGGRIARVRELARKRAGGALGDEPLALPVFSMQSWRGTATAGPDMEADPASTSRLSDTSRPLSFLAYYELREMELLAQLTAGHAKAAGRELRWMHKDFDEADSMLIRARLRVLDAALALDGADYRTAETLLNVSRGEFRAAGLRPELYQCGRLLALCQEKLAFPAAHVLELRHENDALLDEISHSLGPEERALYLVDKWSARETLLGGEIDEFARLQSEVAGAKGWRKLWLGYRALVRLNGIVSRVDDRKPVWRRLLLQSPRKSEIGFLPLPNCTLAWVGGWMSLRARITSAPRIRVRELVAAWQRDAPAQDPRSRNRASRASRELAESLGLFELFAGIRPGVRHLTFHPDDQLNGFPFAALPVSKEPDAAYTGIRWATSVAFPESGGNGRRPARVREAAVVGVAQARGFRPLQEVPGQSAALCKWLVSRGITPASLPDTASLPDARVTRPALLAALRGSQFFHYGGHGLLRLDDPELSGLVLTEPDADGQVLSLRDIVSLPLPRMEHATIAACWAADSFVFPGGRTVGFTRLLIGAGARSVLAPLWEIEDRLSGMFLQKFYSELPGKPRAEALRLARLYVVGEGYANPFWWAGFQLYGDPGRLYV